MEFFFLGGGGGYAEDNASSLKYNEKYSGSVVGCSWRVTSEITVFCP